MHDLLTVDVELEIVHISTTAELDPKRDRELLDVESNDFVV